MFKQARYFTPNRNYTRRFLHQRTSTPEEVLHQTVFTYQEPLIPKTFYTRNLSHHRHLTPKSWYMLTPENSYKKKRNGIFFTAGTFYTKGVLHQKQSTPKSLLHPETPRADKLHRTAFSPGNYYTKRR